MLRLLRRVDSSLLKYFLLWLGVIVAFAVCYWFLSYTPGQGPTQLGDIADPWVRFLTALYFSIVTGATVGYGDIVPMGYSRVFAAVESILSFVILAVFVARITSRKQESAIDDIHSLARDSLFNNFRHGLFIARKDLDVVLSKVEGGETLTDRDWKNVRTAFRQMHTQIDNVPQLYSMGMRGGVIDEDHEQLVLDSVERSLRRARETIALFEERGQSCKTDEKCMSELAAVVAEAHHSFRTLYPHAYNAENDEAFQEMLSRLDELKEHV
jgi:hypothetical protein